MDAELEDAIKDSLDRHKVSPRGRAIILEWATKASISAGLLENVKTGLLDIVGVNRNGEPLFGMTKQGCQYVETKILPRLGDNEGKS